MAGLFVWAIILIIIGACLLPWWFIPACIVAGIISFYFDNK